VNPGPSTLRDGIDPYEHLATKPADADRCPHCNGVGRVVPDDELRFVCALCGGPRFGPLAPGLRPPDEAERKLRDAEKARRGRAGWRAVVATTGIGVGLLGLAAAGLAAFGALKVAALVGLIFVLPFALGLMVSASRARDAAARIGPALDAAWAALAVGAVRSGRAQSPSDLARALGVEPAQAEQLHTVVAVEGELGAAVEPARVRIGEDTGPKSSLAPDPRFEALEAKARAAEAEAAAAQEAAGEERTQLASAKTIIASPGDDGSPR
jgi:hypothetical protein